MAEGHNTVNDGSFEAEVEKYAGTALVDFSAGWCPPCKMLAPIIAMVAAEVAGRAKVLTLDVDESRNTAARFNVLNVPTMIFFRKGKEVDRLVGVASKEKIIERINKLTE
jgi:thioredoxin 1